MFNAIQNDLLVKVKSWVDNSVLEVELGKWPKMREYHS